MKQIIYTPNAPEPIGPYSQAVLINNTLYTSGQIAMDPRSGALVTDEIQMETQVVMENLQAILEAADFGFEEIVKCSIFISDMGNFNQINAVYAGYFPENPPARETVQVAVLPKNVNVEISAIAVKG